MNAAYTVTMTLRFGHVHMCSSLTGQKLQDVQEKVSSVMLLLLDTNMYTVVTSI